MALWQAIVKEIGGRIGNAGASIKSDYNMFEGKKFRQPFGDMLGTKNPNVVGEGSTQDKEDGGDADIESGTEGGKQYIPSSSNGAGSIRGMLKDANTEMNMFGAKKGLDSEDENSSSSGMGSVMKAMNSNKAEGDGIGGGAGIGGGDAGGMAGGVDAGSMGDMAGSVDAGSASDMAGSMS